MDHRKNILDKLYSYEGVDPVEEKMRLQTIEFIKANTDCFERSLKVGHVNGSSWIVDEAFEYVLLTHHAKLDKWFQLGGHSDGDSNTLNVAYREATEESGLKEIEPYNEDIFDIDIHPIPEKGDEPLHLHYDIRFLFTANKSEPLVITKESKELAWVKIEDVAGLNPDKALLRMVNKTLSLRSPLK